MHKPKFRIWSKTLECFITDLSLENLANPETDQLNDIFNNENLIFQQWTGLYDINKKEIYEGDIIEYVTLYQFDKSYKSRDSIKFHNGRFYPIPIKDLCDDDFYSVEFKDFYIIGNILQNKELLKK